MKIIKNVGVVERVIRFVLAEVFFLGAFFFVSPVLGMVLYGISLILLVTAFIGFCPLYTVLHIGMTKNYTEFHKRSIVVIATLLVVMLLGGAYASHFFTKKIFIEDFNAMNVSYKQTLFETGQGKRTESVNNYQSLVSAYAKFEKKYTSYTPYVFRGDAQFTEDLYAIGDIIEGVRTNVESGDLKIAHLELEKVRPITQELFKRNGFSLLAIVLMDFHDSMEKVVDPASAKDKEGVIRAYEEANAKLMAVEQITDDAEIQAIRTNLDAVLQLAKDNNLEALPAKGAELKSSFFVKVYLKRG